jgi:hypothetical protein
LIFGVWSDGKLPAQTAPKLVVRAGTFWRLFDIVTLSDEGIARIADMTDSFRLQDDLFAVSMMLKVIL